MDNSAYERWQNRQASTLDLEREKHSAEVHPETGNPIKIRKGEIWSLDVGVFKVVYANEPYVKLKRLKGN